MARVCIWGASLQKTADEAQVDAVVQILQQRLPHVFITLFSRDADVMAERYARLEAIPTRDLGRVTRALSRADLLVLVAGPFVETAHQALSAAVLILIATMTRTPIIGYGITLFPMQTWWGRRTFRFLMERLRFIAPRERVGAEIMRGLGIGTEIFQTADPRFVLAPSAPERIRALLAEEGVALDRPCVAVTMRHFDDTTPKWVRNGSEYTSERDARAKDSLARALDALDPAIQVVFMPMHPDYRDDENAARGVVTRMSTAARAHLLSRQLSAQEAIGIIAHADMLVACRVGSAVFASLSGTPVVGISYEPRMTDHLERMDLEDCVVDWRNLDPKQVTERVQRVWHDREAMRTRVGAKRDEMAALAREGAELVADELELLLAPVAARPLRR